MTTDALPYYPVLRGLWNGAARDLGQGCPICGKAGRWVGDRYVPTNERQPGHPRCYCATLARAGGTSYDPVTRTVLGGQASGDDDA